MRMRRAAAVVALAAALPTGAGFALDAARARPRPLGPGLVTVEVVLRHSRFSPSAVDVYEGTLVRFVVVNEDPIHHELIVGPDDVHAAHERGTEHHHPPVPGEVSVQPHQRGLTVYRFDTPGTVVVGCHLRGHFGYGMSGQVVVHPLPDP